MSSNKFRVMSSIDASPSQISMLIVIARYLSIVDAESLLATAKKGLSGKSLEVAKAMIRSQFPDFPSEEVPFKYPANIREAADYLCNYAGRLSSD